MSGTLFVVATPLGNLEDISPRVLDTLKKADIIAAEDTRVSMKLGQQAGSLARFKSLHQWNEKKEADFLIRTLLEGKSIALVTDAGTPAISDPGFLLVAEAHKVKIPVSPIPGPSAVVSACSVSGFDCRQFAFVGFLPRKENEIHDALAALESFAAPIVFFEAPSRILETVILLEKILSPETQLCLCKELSKKFETVLRAPLPEIRQTLEQLDLRGEWTGVLEKVRFRSPVIVPASPVHKTLEDVCAFFKVPRSTAAKILSLATGRPRRELYQE